MKQMHGLMYGGPGSGKSSLARNLAADRRIFPSGEAVITVHSDMARYQSPEFASDVRKDRSREDLQVGLYAGMEHAVGQALHAGVHVLTDNMHGFRAWRDRERGYAPSGLHLGQFVLWVVTRPEVAAQRVLTREGPGVVRYDSQEQFWDMHACFERTSDKPDDDENVIRVDGELPYDDPDAPIDQHRQFVQGYQDTFGEEIG